MIRELPILFSAAMVLALLAGRKTQTRRIPPRELWHDVEAMLAWARKRYGDPGDVLYVREARRVARIHDRTPPNLLPARLGDGSVFYEAGPDALDRELQDLLADDYAWGKLRPGIHMPKPFSRSRLQRTDELRVNHSALVWNRAAASVTPCPDGCPWLRDGFSTGWDDINGDRGAWDENPPVVVISFDRQEGGEPCSK